jgi:mRNA interferase RelE/StbE
MSTSTNYELQFLPSALKEWKKLDPSIRRQLKKKLAERLHQPHVPGSRLRGFDAVYKIKLRASGYRLVYQVKDDQLIVLVIAIARRDREEVYKRLKKRLS